MGLGNDVSATLDADGETDLYRFTLASPTRLYFDSLTFDSAKVWSLLGPRGYEISSRAFSRSDGTDLSGNAILDLPAGNYQLRVERSEARRVGKSVSVRVDIGGRRIIKKKKTT